MSLKVCVADGSGREELKKWASPSPAVLWMVNVGERKPRKKTFKSFLLVIDSLIPIYPIHDLYLNSDFIIGSISSSFI